MDLDQLVMYGDCCEKGHFESKWILFPVEETLTYGKHWEGWKWLSLLWVYTCVYWRCCCYTWELGAENLNSYFRLLIRIYKGIKDLPQSINIKAHVLSFESIFKSRGEFRNWQLLTSNCHWNLGHQQRCQATTSRNSCLDEEILFLCLQLVSILW